MRNKFLLFSLLIGSMIFQGVNAGVVPGTIKSSTVTANVSCGSSYNYYAPTNGYCDSWTKTAKVNSWDYLYDYSDSSGNSGYYAPGSGFTAIDAGETCSWESKGTYHTPHTPTNFNCTFVSGSGTTYDSNTYESGGSNGNCTPKKGVDNLITSFNQIGSVLRMTSLTGGACKVQGRYATTDNLAPVSTVNNVSNVFLNKDTIWCNIEKYKDSGYDKKLHPGCAEYAKQNTNISGNQDLLKGLDIKIDNDVSGIWKVDIKLGTCSTSYISPITDVGILQSTTSANGVKLEYTNGFVIDYDTSFTAFGVTQPSLLNKMGKSRLDECLGNGKNNLVITTYDMSRGVDGVSLAGNSKTFTTPGIFIDNNTSVLEKTGDLVKDESSDPDMWRNFSLQGNIKVGEDVNNKSSGECTLSTLSGSCGAPNPGNVWVAPLGVNPTTGEFIQYKCDGLTFPSTSECVQKPLPPIPKICTGTIPSTAIQSNTGGLIVDTPWQNTDSTARCYFEVPVVYCTAGGTVPCVVKPGGPVVTPGIDGVCGVSDNTTVSSAPVSGLCSIGTASAVNGTGPWSWNCLGSGGGNDVSCSASKIIVSSCPYEPTITGGGGKFGGGPGPRCYNNPANDGGGVNVKYTCDTAGNLFYDGLPSIIGAYKFVGADKENCFVGCMKPSTCGTPKVSCDNSEISGLLQADIYNTYKSQESGGGSGYSQWDFLDVDACTTFPSGTTPDGSTLSGSCKVKGKFCFYNSASVLEGCNGDTDTTDGLTLTCDNGVWKK